MKAGGKPKGELVVLLGGWEGKNDGIDVGLLIYVPPVPPAPPPKAM